MLELTEFSHIGFGWLPVPKGSQRVGFGSVWVSVARTPVGVEMLVGSVVPADVDGAPEPVRVVADHGDREYRVIADEVTGAAGPAAGPGIPRLSYLILPADVGHGPDGSWDVQVVMPGQEAAYQAGFDELRGAEGDLRLLLPPAVVHEDAEWIVWHSGVIVSPQGSHVVAMAARRPGAPLFTDPWPRQPVRALFTHGDEEPPFEEAGRTDAVPPFDAYVAMTHTTASAPAALVVVLDDPTRNEPIRVQLPLSSP